MNNLNLQNLSEVSLSVCLLFFFFFFFFNIYIYFERPADDALILICSYCSRDGGDPPCVCDLFIYFFGGGVCWFGVGLMLAHAIAVDINLLAGLTRGSVGRISY